MTTTSPLQNSTIDLRMAIALVAGSAEVVIAAISTAIAQQDLGPTSMTNASGATTTTNPQIAPSTPQIAFAKPTVKAPRYGKG